MQQRNHLKQQIDSFLLSNSRKASDGGQLAVVVIDNVESIPEILELKNYIDAEVLRINSIDEKKSESNEVISFKGIGFILTSYNLPKDVVACQKVDSLRMDKEDLKWTNNFIGRITYRTKLCIKSHNS